MKKTLLAWMLGLLPLLGFSQSVITGIAADAASGEPLAGASIRLDNTRWGATADLQGRFELRNVAAGSYVLVASYVGFKTFRQTIAVGQEPLTLELQLEKSSLQADEVVVSAIRAN
jgi:hypothetical protein